MKQSLFSLKITQSLLVAASLVAVGVMAAPGAAVAACANPSGSGGDVVFNTTHKVLQFCDDTNWVALGQSRGATEPTAGLIAHWPLDEAAGGTVNDSAGSVNGTIVGNPVWRPTGGRIGGALEFDGSGDTVRMGDNATLEPTEITVCLWAQRTGAGDGVNGQILVDKQHWNNGGYLLAMEPEATSIRWRVLSAGSGGTYTISSAVTTSDWHHYCASYDGTTSRLYVDGDLKSTMATSYVAPSSAAFRLGSNGGANYWFHGLMDDVRMYNRALSGDEVMDLYIWGSNSCESPEGNPGDMVYNTTHNVVQYCNGKAWISTVSDAIDGGTAIISTPTLLGTITADFPNHMVKSGNYIYVADSWNSSTTGGLNIFDVSDPADLVALGSVSNANMQGAYGVDISGNHVFVGVSTDNGIVSVNVSNPSSPSYVSYFTHANLGGARGVKINGSYAYVAANSSDRLTVVDISNPSSMSYVGSVANASLNGASNLRIVGNYAYVASFVADSLTVVDISTPASPTHTGSVAGMDGATAVAISGNYAYVAASNADAVYVVDISNPASPTIVGSITDAQLDGAEGIDIKGNYAIVSTSASSDRIVIVDVSNPASPSIYGASASNSSAFAGGQLIVDGNYAYVIGDFKLSTIDLRAPCSNPAGVTGDVTYNSSYNKMQFCNGSLWVSMGAQ